MAHAMGYDSAAPPALFPDGTFRSAPTTNFEWRATDYQKRTVPEIIEIRGGNCNELALVTVAALKSLNLRIRKVHEINIYKESTDRGERAHQLVQEKGLTYSVFGRHHNDHIWMEIYNTDSKEWFPVDPSIGLAGLDEWIPARAGFGKRYSLDPSSEDMIVPFAILAADESGAFTINRTQFYMVNAFDRF